MERTRRCLLQLACNLSSHTLFPALAVAIITIITIINKLAVIITSLIIISFQNSDAESTESDVATAKNCDFEVLYHYYARCNNAYFSGTTLGCPVSQQPIRK